MNNLPPAVAYGRIDPRKKPAAASITPPTRPDAGFATSGGKSTGYSRVHAVSTVWVLVVVRGSPQIRAFVRSSTGGTTSAHMPTRARSEALRLGRGARRQEPQLALQVEQLLIRVGLHFDRLGLLEQRVARQILVHLGRRDELALFVLDLLRHLLERLERALVADRRHRFLNALVRLGTLLARDQDVLLALGFLDPIVELAQRDLELVRFLAVLDPRIVQLQGGLRVLVVAQQRLLRQVVAPFLDGQHGALLPVLGGLFLLVDLGRQPLLVGDRRRNLLLRLGQLGPHVDDQLVQHLLGVLSAGDQVVDVRPDERRETVKDSHDDPLCAGGPSLSRAQLTAPLLGEQPLGEI